MKKFLEYRQVREHQDFATKLNAFCHHLLESGVSLSEAVSDLPNPLMGRVSSPDDVLNELFGMFRRKAQAAPSSPMPLKNMPFADPHSFRPKADREVSRSDMYAANANTAAYNKSADAHNMGVQRNDIRQQGKEKMIALKQQMVQYANTLKGELNRKLGVQKGVLQQKNASSPQHSDIADQFVDYVTQAVNMFDPKIDLSKYWKDHDFSGVKSGLGADHMAPTRYQPEYSRRQQGTGLSTAGQYTTNQPLGDQERAARGTPRRF